MKSRAFCMSLSRRTEDFPERLEEYATIWGTTKSGANYRILNEWEKLKMKERFRELQGVG